MASPTTARVTIIDDDISTPTSNPSDDARYFVRQHYYDFLNREPDQGGWDYWTKQISECGNDQACIQKRRVAVSNAFSFEQEYQQTGSYVFRLYRAAYGNNQPFPNSDPANPTEGKKLPSYVAFSRDRARVIGGSQLGPSKLNLATQFVQRPEFIARYPQTQDATAFITAILNVIKRDSGADLASQFNALLGLYNGGGNQVAGRAAVLNALADDNIQSNPTNNRAFIDAEFNRVFVVTQYFGYLRRDPDIAGLLFWIAEVNKFPLRNIQIENEIVCSFVTSLEYQFRFSYVTKHSNRECGP
jgi:hypothetical protein